MTSNATGNAEIHVSTTLAESIFGPSITLLPAGGWIAVWTASSETPGNEFQRTLMQRFDADGSPVGAETQVGDPEVGYISSAVVPLADGGWLIIHDRGDIVQQRFDAAGNAVGDETQINTVSGDLRAVAATVLENGSWVVGWQRGAGGEDVFQQMFDATGTAVGGEVRVNTTTSGRHLFSDIEALADGGWVVAWFTTSDDVFQQRFDADGDPVGVETRVNTSDGNNDRPKVAGLADGGWVVTWYGPDGDLDGIFQQRYDSDGAKVGTETQVNTTTASLQDDPDVAALSDGGWVIVWRSNNQDGDRSGIYQQRFAANGDTDGTETLVNVTTEGSQTDPSVAALDGGGWIVTWTSDDPDTGGETVQQRIFANIEGTDGNDTLTGTAFDETIRGNGGDDTIDGGAGADTLDGGDGIDTLSYAGSVAGVSVNLSTGAASGGDAEGDTISNFENLTGSDHDDVLTGDTGNNVLTGGKGKDRFIWNDGDGSDDVNGGAGADTIEVNLSDDATGDVITLSSSNNLTLERTNLEQFTISVQGVERFEINGHGGDDEIDASNVRVFVTLDGGDGNDILRGGIFNSTIRGGAGADQMFGGGGSNNMLDYSGSSAGVEIDLGTGSAAGGDAEGDTFDDSFTGIIGSDHNDVLRGRLVNQKEQLFGGKGNDTLVGGDGEDQLFGGDGDDLLIDGGRGDLLDGGDGIDTMSVANRTISMTIDLAAGTASNGTTIVDVENVIGTTKADTIIGNDVANVLEGRDGDDTLDGGAGADTLVGGTGDDTYIIDNAGNTIEELFDEGTDTIISSISFALRDQSQNLENLTLTGTALFGTGNGLANTITGNDGNNTLNGAFGDDTLIGGAGNDTFKDDDGADRMVGGLGNDTYFVDNVGDKTIELAGEGTDTVISSVNYFLWDQSQHIETLTLTGTANIDGGGNKLANTLTGNAGNNVLNGGTNADRMVGGLGNDTYHVDNAGDTIKELFDEGTDTVISSINLALRDQSQNLENLTLTGTALFGTGNGLANTITGNDGNNTLNGAFGDDTLIGGAGNDTFKDDDGADRMLGGLGNDTYFVDNVGDKTIELAGQGTDTVNSSVNYFLWDQSQHIETLTLTGTANIDGGGNKLANTLTGNAGNNVLNGGTNADRMVGGLGNDTYFVDNAGDTTIELAGEGTDTVNSSVNYFLWDQSQHIETLTLTGTANINAGGNALANTLTGNAGNNDLNGGANADRMVGGAGNDTYHVDNAGDTTVELADGGTDTVISSISFALRDQGQFLENLTLSGTGNIFGTGNGLANVITGNAGNNGLNGAFGDDTLIGGAGNDTFRDDAGNDIFTGGSGADTFFFLGAGESDRITDFENGVDSMTIGLGVTSFADITVTDAGADAILTFGSNTVTLENFDHTLVSSDDFSFV